MNSQSRIDKYALGLALLLAVVFGGGSMSGLFIDTMLMLFVVGACTLALAKTESNTRVRHLTALAFLPVAIVAFQFIPLPTSLLNSTQHILPPNVTELLTSSWRTTTLNTEHTVFTLVWVSVAAFLFFTLSSMHPDKLYGLLPFVLVGVLCNIAVAFFQFLSSSQAITKPAIGYDIVAGFFSNPNHFSSLIVMALPVFFFYLGHNRQRMAVIALLVVSVFILFAAGSRAGVISAFIVIFLSIALLLRESIKSATALLFTGLAAIPIAIFVGLRFESEGFSDVNRLKFSTQTFHNAIDNLPFGIGYGNFADGYARYEGAENIFAKFVNHAHNEYVELLFEGGIPFVIVFLICIFALIQRIVKTVADPMSNAVSISIFFIMMHSLVDYPLRTFSVSCFFILCLAMLFNPRQHSGQQH